MSNLRKRTSAQRSDSKRRQMVAAFNDMEARIERYQTEARITESRHIDDGQASVSEQFLKKPPFFADRYKVERGSEDERINLRYLMQNSFPRFSDRELRITLY